MEADDYVPLEIGQKLYRIKQTLNSFNRKKIFMTDDNGVEWYRYDKPHAEYELIELEIVGRVLTTIEGVVQGIEEYQDVYTVKNPTGGYESIEQYEIDDASAYSSEAIFTSRVDAEEYMAYKISEVDRIGRS